MNCRIIDLKNKEVVCVRDGSLLGPVGDVEFDTETAKVTAIVVYGRPRLLGVIGRDEDLTIPWSDIEVIGEDTVLVNCAHIPHRSKGFFGTKAR